MCAEVNKEICPTQRCDTEIFFSLNYGISQHLFKQMRHRLFKYMEESYGVDTSDAAIRKAVEEAPDYGNSGLTLMETQTLAEAVAAAKGAAVSGDVVVLSPACAAFDQFKNFMERGKVFKDLVNAL